MHLFHRMGIAIAALAMAGCIHPYKLEIHQGNVVTKEMVDKLKPGMTKNQVRFVLGTPLITDPFHAERWDYIYVYKKNAAAPAQTHQLTLIFDRDTLARMEGDLAKAYESAPGEPRSDTADDDNNRLRTPSAPATARAR
jgi:outer membrane protein assembly factor BamE